MSSIIKKIKKPLGITLLGVNERDRARLELFLDRHWSSNCVLVPEEYADLCILELDGLGGQKLLQQQQELYPHRPLIVLSIHDIDIDIDGVTLLRKPLSVNLLKSAIDSRMSVFVPHTPVVEIPTPEAAPRSVAERASADRNEQKPSVMEFRINERRRSLPDTATQARIIRGSCSRADNIEPTNPSDTSNLYYDPGIYFQHALKDAIGRCKREFRPLRLSMPGEKYIVLLPEVDLALTSLSDSKLRPRCVLPIKQHQIRIDYPEESAFDLLYANEVTVQEFDGLLWKVALWSARGRLPAGIDIEAIIGLQKWPNLTRLLSIPQFLRIASLWVKTPSSLRKTPELLNIESRYVYAFFSACYALELIQSMSTTEGQDVLQNNPENSTIPKGVLQRILRRLHVA